MRRILPAVVIGLVLAFPALAQVAPVTFPDTIMTTLTGAIAGWTTTFQNYARNTFNLLAMLTVAWSLAKLALRGAVMEQIVAELVNLIMFVGFGLFVLNNGPGLLKTVIDSFRQAGGTAGGIGLSPAEILTSGLQIAGDVWGQMPRWDPAAAAAIIIVAVVLLLCIGWIAGWMLIALAQAAFYIPIATFFTAFLAHQFSAQMGRGVLMQSFAIGAKLMTMQLLAATCLTLIRTMLGVLRDFTGPAAGVVICASLALALLTKYLPDWVQSIVGGHPSPEGGMVLGAGIAGTAIAATAATAAVGAPVALAQAARLASAQVNASQPEGGGSALGNAARIVGGTASNLGGAIASDVGRKLSGTGGRFGSSPWRIAADLGNQRRLLEDDGKAPVPANRGGSGGTGGGGGNGGGGGPPEPWMSQSGGFDAMSQEHQASAQSSYQAWSDANPELGRRHDLRDYTSYVQDRQAERDGRAPT